MPGINPTNIRVSSLSSNIRPGALSTQDAAVYLGVKTQTLYNWAQQGVGPRRRRLRRGSKHSRIVYLVSDLDKYLAACEEA